MIARASHNFPSFSVFFCLQLNGVTVGEIQADLSGHGVKVDSHEEVNMYQTKTKSLTISGEGFDPDNTLFRFTNGIRENVNYTSVITQDSATLTLMDGNKWKLVSDGRDASILVGLSHTLWTRKFTLMHRRRWRKNAFAVP